MRRIWTLNSALRFSLFYALIAGLLISFGDRVLNLLVSDRDQLITLQTYKEWGFIAITTLLLYLWLSQKFQQSQHTEKLSESENLYHTLINNFPNGAVLLFDHNLRYLIGGGKGLKVHGLSRELLQGKTIWEVFPPETCQKIEPDYRAALAGKETVTEIWFEDHLYLVYHLPVTDEEGKILAGMVLTQDITENRATEEVLQQTNRQLEIKVVQRTTELNQVNEELRNEIAERQQTEEELQRQNLRSQLLAEISLKIRQSLQLEKILEVTVTEVRSLLQVDRVLILRLLPDGSGSKVVKEAVAANYPVLLGQSFVAEVFPPELHELYRQGKIQRIENVENAPIAPCHVEFLQNLGVRAKLVVPILQGDKLWGLLIAHQCTISRQWNSFEIELLQQLANQAGIALAQAQLLETVQESEKQFRQLTENINEVFWMVQPDLNQILYISPAYEKIWGRSCESLYQDGDSWLYAVHPDDQSLVINAIAKRSHDGEFFNQEYRIVRPDGSWRWIWAREFPIYNEAGEVYRIAGIAEDITERKQSEEEIRKALQKEKELNELKSRFISMTSHEFRTPLATILASSDLLKQFDHKLSPQKKQERLDKIQSEVKGMIKLLDDVLVIAKAEAEKVEFKPNLLNLEKYCREVIEEFEITAQNHIFNFSCQGDLQTVYLDEKLLKHILNNLLSNAVKYSPQGGNIYLDIIRDEQKAILKIADQGIGIPESSQKRLFETFHRASNVDDIPGTGLGMAIVKNAVDIHQGSITFTSQIGAGTTFIITLPINHYPHELN